MKDFAQYRLCATEQIGTGTVPRRRVSPSNAFTEFHKSEIEQTIPTRFEQQVSRFPHRLAVKTADNVLSYDALNRLANRIAYVLLKQHGPEQEPVALLLEKGSAVIAATFGVLKAGKFYVLLEPASPIARLRFFLDDSQAGCLITNDLYLPMARKLCENGITVINLDTLDPALSDQNPALFISPEAPAYILYTSGSTGTPKGVFQNHRNVLHYIRIYTNAFHINPQDRLTLLPSYTFTGAMRDTFSALFNGAALFPYDIKQEGLVGLADWLRHEQITIYVSISTVFRHFIATLTGTEQFSNLRIMNIGGESVHVQDFEMYCEHFSPQCLFVNDLGTTETGTYRLFFADQETTLPDRILPAGYAVDDKEVFLLGEQGKPVSTGQVGEIAVKSQFLSLGYWRRPEITQAVFHPAPEEDDTRIYLTGDLGYLLPDDCLVHLGRKDFQIKIRGYRIEPGEIEDALLQLENVKEALVMGYEGAGGVQGLVAYVVPVRHSVPTTSSLRNALSKTLPNYLIPSTFIFLDALPITPVGKVDRRALPLPDQTRPTLVYPFVAPDTPIERQLGEIWKEVLHLDKVGIHDPFLELGGDSLLATQILSRVRNVFEVEIPQYIFFEASTIVEMALIILQHKVSTIAPEVLEEMLIEIEGMGRR